MALREKNGDICKIERHSEGGTFVAGGTTDADLNITYNYSWFYDKFLDKERGLRWLDGKKAKDCIDKLEKAVCVLGIHKYKDYWAPTHGNAGIALSILLKWAKQHPEAIFEVV